MAIDNADYISQLTPTIPLNTDPRSEGAAGMRNTKLAVQQSFPNVDAEVSATAAVMNDVFSHSGFTLGMMMMWSGQVEDVPVFWSLCDGTNVELVSGGTYVKPDLSNRFALGASYDELGDPIDDIGDVGGSNNPNIAANLSVDGHILTVDEMPSHTHDVSLSRGDEVDDSSSGSQTRLANEITVTHPTGGDLAHVHPISTILVDPEVPDAYVEFRPAFYTVAYIVFTGPVVAAP